VLGHPAGGDPEGTGPPPPRLGFAARGQLGYFGGVVPPQLAATVLLERCGPRLQPDDLETLAALAEGDLTLRGVLAHARTLRALRAKDDDALAALAGMAWRRWSRWRTRGDAPPFADGRHNLGARPTYVDYGPDPDPDPEPEPEPEGAQNGSSPGRGRRPWRRK
jgi:hypothetical protein